MATDEELNQIRTRIDIQELISHYVTLKKAGANYKALCPFHEEKTGSFMVSPEKQIYKCFGCNEGGDIFNFVMKIEALTFPEAVQFLADRAGVKVSANTTSPEKKESKNDLFALNEMAAKYFETLLNHPVGSRAKEYLLKRKITENSIKKFRIGYAPSKRLLKELLLKKGFSQSQITAAGQPDRFANRIMFPICDPIGNIIAFTGREFPDGQGPKYLNTADTILFHKSKAVYGLNHAKIAIRQKQSVIFVEGQMDVISSSQTGIENVVASSGTALTPDHLKILYRYAQHFILAFDNDEAGIKATEKVLAMAQAEDYNTDVIILPDHFKDAGEIIEKEPELWPKIVSKAIPGVDWYFNRTFLPFTEQNLTGNAKKEISKKLMPIIGQIKNPVEKNHYLQKLAKRLDVSINLLTVSENPAPKSEGIKSNEYQKLSLEETVIMDFMQYPKICVEFIQYLDENLFSAEYLEVVKSLKKWYNNPEVSKKSTKELISFLFSRLSESENLIIKKIFDASLHPSNELEAKNDTDLIRDEIRQSLKHLRVDYYENKKLGFAKAISLAEENGDRNKVKELLKQLQTFIGSSGGTNG